jgi:hypothetical protein
MISGGRPNPPRPLASPPVPPGSSSSPIARAPRAVGRALALGHDAFGARACRRGGRWARAERRNPSLSRTAVHTSPDRLSLLIVVPDNAVIPIVGARRSPHTQR